MDSQSYIVACGIAVRVILSYFGFNYCFHFDQAVRDAQLRHDEAHGLAAAIAH